MDRSCSPAEMPLAVCPGRELVRACGCAFAADKAEILFDFKPRGISLHIKNKTASSLCLAFSRCRIDVYGLVLCCRLAVGSINVVTHFE